MIGHSEHAHHGHDHHHEEHGHGHEGGHHGHGHHWLIIQKDHSSKIFFNKFITLR